MQQLIILYLDYFNSFLSVGKFAEHYSLDEDDASLLIEMGRKYHERQVELNKLNKQ